ncbi:hypothetical protein D3C75_754180 [compost metagenome]
MAGAVGTSLLVTVMTSRTTTHLTTMMASGGAKGATQEHMIMEASIQGINDAYLVIVGIGVIALLLAFFIKRVGQASGEETEVQLKKAIAEKA